MKLKKIVEKDTGWVTLYLEDYKGGPVVSGITVAEALLNFNDAFQYSLVTKSYYEFCEGREIYNYLELSGKHFTEEDICSNPLYTVTPELKTDWWLKVKRWFRFASPRVEYNLYLWGDGMNVGDVVYNGVDNLLIIDKNYK